MAAFNYIQKHYPDYVERARLFEYPESSLLILMGDEENLKSRYSKEYNNLLSCKHNRDSRTPFEYGKDLVSSWLFEDIIVSELRNSGLEIYLSGADREREVLANSKVSSTSDCTVRNNGQNRPLEIMCDYSSYWTRYHRLDLRDSKHQRLSDEHALLLGISLNDNKYLLFDYNTPIDSKYIPRHYPYGGKPAVEIIVKDEDLRPFIIKDLASNILKRLQ